MKLTKTIYKNNEEINIFNYDNEIANNELTNLLLNKIGNKYKITIIKDHIQRTIKANLYFNHEQSNGATIKYNYEYLFENVSNYIDLY